MKVRQQPLRCSYCQASLGVQARAILTQALRTEFHYLMSFIGSSVP